MKAQALGQSLVWAQAAVPGRIHLYAWRSFFDEDEEQLLRVGAVENLSMDGQAWRTCNRYFKTRDEAMAFEEKRVFSFFDGQWGSE